MYHMAAFIADGVPVFDIRQAAGMTDLLVRDAQAGPCAGRVARRTSPSALMRHHGAVVVADSIPNVVGRSVYLDLNARVQIQTVALGGKATTSIRRKPSCAWPTRTSTPAPGICGSGRSPLTSGSPAAA